MRLIFLNRYFHPDHSATSQMLSDLAFFLAAARLPAHESINGMEVHRVRNWVVQRRE